MFVFDLFEKKKSKPTEPDKGELYKSTKHAEVRAGIDQYRREFPGASDVEAAIGHAFKQDQINQQQQREIDQLEKDERAIRKSYADQEKRFQDFNKKVAGMDLTPPEAARAAQDVERGAEPERAVSTAQTTKAAQTKPTFNPKTGTPPAGVNPSAKVITRPVEIPAGGAASAQQTAPATAAPANVAPAEPTTSPALGQMVSQLAQTPGRVVSPKQQMAQYQEPAAVPASVTPAATGTVPSTTGWAANQPTVQPKPTTGAGKVKDIGTLRQQKANSLMSLVSNPQVANLREAVASTPFVQQVAQDNLQKFINAYVANHDTVDIEAPGSLLPIKIKRKQIRGVMDILDAMPDSETKKTLVLNLFGNPSYLLQFIHEYLTNKGEYVPPVSDPNQGELEEDSWSAGNNAWSSEHNNWTAEDAQIAPDSTSPIHGMEEDGEGTPEGLPHLTRELLSHIVDQVGQEGAHAIVKSLEWGDGAARDLLALILKNLKQDITDKEIDECLGNMQPQGVAEEWSKKYKSSINCSHPKGFSQKAHCAGKRKHNESHDTMEMVCTECGMCETHGNNLIEIKQRLDAKCWSGKHKEGTKIKGGVRVNNCVPNESVKESLRPGEYHVWTVHFNDSTTGKIRVPSDEYDDDLIKAHYAKKGKTVVKIDHDWAVHSKYNESVNYWHKLQQDRDQRQHARAYSLLESLTQAIKDIK